MTRDSPANARVGGQTKMSGSPLDGGLARSARVNWPVLSGVIPQLTDSHVPRHETGLGLAASLAPGDTAVLIPSDEAGRSLGGLGGTGKTQLALAVAHALWDRRALDLVVWVCPSTRDAVVTAYAQAMRDIRGGGLRGARGKGRRAVSRLADRDPPAVADHPRRSRRRGRAGGAVAARAAGTRG